MHTLKIARWSRGFKTETINLVSLEVYWFISHRMQSSRFQFKAKCCEMKLNWWFSHKNSANDIRAAVVQRRMRMHSNPFPMLDQFVSDFLAYKIQIVESLDTTNRCFSFPFHLKKFLVDSMNCKLFPKESIKNWLSKVKTNK